MTATVLHPRRSFRTVPEAVAESMESCVREFLFSHGRSGTLGAAWLFCSSDLQQGSSEGNHGPASCLARLIYACRRPTRSSSLHCQGSVKLRWFAVMPVLLWSGCCKDINPNQSSKSRFIGLLLKLSVGPREEKAQLERLVFTFCLKLVLLQRLRCRIGPAWPPLRAKRTRSFVLFLRI